MSEDKFTFRTTEKKMDDGTTIVFCEVEPNDTEHLLPICKAIENFRDRVRRQEEPFFEKLPDEIKTEIQKAHLEMVLNRDFKPIYVNVAPNAPIHKVNFETEAKTPKEECT